MNSIEIFINIKNTSGAFINLEVAMLNNLYIIHSFNVYVYMVLPLDVHSQIHLEGENES